MDKDNKNELITGNLEGINKLRQGITQTQQKQLDILGITENAFIASNDLEMFCYLKECIINRYKPLLESLTAQYNILESYKE